MSRERSRIQSDTRRLGHHAREPLGKRKPINTSVLHESRPIHHTSRRAASQLSSEVDTDVAQRPLAAFQLIRVKIELLALSALTVSCATWTSALDQMSSACATSVCAHVSLKSDVASISLGIPKALLSNRDSIELRFPEAVLGETFLRSVQKTAGEPWPTVFSVNGNGLYVDYQVKLGSRFGVPPERLRELSFQHPRGWHLKGYELLPEINLDAPGLIQFAVEPGEDVLAPLPSIAPNQFKATRALELSRSSYELGRLHRLCAKLDAIKTCVASSELRDERELSAMMELTARALQSSARRLGKLEERHLLISHHAHKYGGAYGITIGSSVTILALRAPQELRKDSSPSPSQFLLVHELLHLWMPGSRSIRPLWLREGLTQYLAYQTMAEMTGLPAHEYAFWINEAYRRYRAARYDVVIADTDDELVYPAGVVAGFCLDRELGPQGSSTSEVIRSVLESAEDRSSTQVTEDWFLAELSRVSPRAAGYFKLLISERRFNFSNCMQQLISRHDMRQ
jgi:hypothetical protein